MIRSLVHTRGKPSSGIAAVVATALAAMPVPGAGTQVDTSDWSCEYCPFASGHEVDAQAGATYLSDDTEQLGSATGYDESGAYLDVGGTGLYATDDYRLEWFAQDLALDSRVLEIDGARPGRFDYHLSYHESPYRLFDTTRTVFTATSADTLALPADWVRASRSSGFTTLSKSLRGQDIESDRKTLAAGGEIELGRGLELFADYRRHVRDGVDIVSVSNFVQAAMLPRMIDFETDLVDLGLAYRRGPLSLRLTWFGSFFDNASDSLTWDNPFTSFPGADRGRVAREPDNEFGQLSLSGTYSAAPLSTVIAFSAARGEGEQDEQLIAYTINPMLNAPDLPRGSLGGKVETTSYAVTLTSRPAPRTRLRLAYRLDERDNSTPRSTWMRVVVDGFLSGEDELNVPYSFERSSLGLQGSYDLFDSLRVSAGYDRKELDRDFQEVAEQTEDAGWGRVRWRPTAALELSVGGGTAKREIGRYDESLATFFGQNPLLRKYNLAYRYREHGELALSYAPAEKPYSAVISARYSDDSYTKSRLGMLSGNELHLSADFAWAFSEKTSVYLNLASEDIESEQAGSARFGEPDWRAFHDDDFTTVGVGVHARDIAEGFDLQFDYTLSDGESEISLGRGPGAPGEFPELRNEHDSLRLKLSYRKSERLRVNLELRYQRFRGEDWALEGVAPGTIPVVLGLGAQPYSPEFYAIGIGLRYAIGGAAER